MVTKHIGHYLGRPVIATSRIDRYDGKYVTFHYNRHEDNKYVEGTIPVIEFIQHLIKHISKNIPKRYVTAIYMQGTGILKKLRRSIFKEKHRIYRSFHQ
ncbi:MAG: transposase [Blautia faecis]|nr:transposase [Ruminococcus sp. 1001136sp1]MDB8773761.1 transposase [Ruminococcus sp. 1001136sp1]MDB8785062.1 transposase [Ruminococcus sp. 1001136sp1]